MKIELNEKELVILIREFKAPSPALASLIEMAKPFIEKIISETMGTGEQAPGPGPDKEIVI